MDKIKHCSSMRPLLTYFHRRRPSSDGPSFLRITSADSVTIHRWASDDGQSGQLVYPHNRRLCGPHGARRGPTLPSDHSRRNYRRRCQRCPLLLRRRRQRAMFRRFRAAEVAAAALAAVRRTSTSRAEIRPPRNYRGTHVDSGQHRQLVGSK